MTFFKSGYFNPQYFGPYWQEVGEGDTAQLVVNASATASFTSAAAIEAVLNASGQASVTWASIQPEVSESTFTSVGTSAVAWTGQGGLPDEVPVQPEQVIGGAAKRAQPPLLRPFEAFEPETVYTSATVSGTAHVEAEALYDDPVVIAEEKELSAKIAAQDAQFAQQEIDEDDQIILSFVTAFLSAENGCEINGIFS